MLSSEPSLFTQLKNLFPRSGFPSEDYLSEIVAAVIRRHPADFIAWLHAMKITSMPDTAFLSVETQYHCAEDTEDKTSEKYPDFLIRLSDGSSEELVMIEAKVGSDLSGDDQLQVYARILSRLPASKRTLLFITRDYHPQDESEVLSLVPSQRERPAFRQTRWFHYANHLLRKNSLLRSDPLVTELLSFMKSENLTQNHQFTPADISAITVFSHACSVMRAAIDADLKKRLEAVCGELMDDYDKDIQVVRGPMLTIRNRLKTKNIGVNLGFWLEPDDDGYPLVFGDISFDAKSEGKKDIIESLRAFADASGGKWVAENLTEMAPWGRILRQTSLSTFLHQPNHAAAVKDFLIEIIEDIARFKASYPTLQWVK